MTTRLQRVAVWIWDRFPGGVPAQVVFSDRFPVLAQRLDDLAHRRDRELVVNRRGGVR